MLARIIRGLGILARLEEFERAAAMEMAELGRRLTKLEERVAKLEMGVALISRRLEFIEAEVGAEVAELKKSVEMLDAGLATASREIESLNRILERLAGRVCWGEDDS